MGSSWMLDDQSVSPISKAQLQLEMLAHKVRQRKIEEEAHVCLPVCKHEYVHPVLPPAHTCTYHTHTKNKKCETRYTIFNPVKLASDSHSCTAALLTDIPGQIFLFFPFVALSGLYNLTDGLRQLLPISVLFLSQIGIYPIALPWGLPQQKRTTAHSLGFPDRLRLPLPCHQGHTISSPPSCALKISCRFQLSINYFHLVINLSPLPILLIILIIQSLYILQ